MPIISSIESKHQLIVHRCRGDLNVQDFIEAFDAAFELYGYKPGMNVLWDLQLLKLGTPFGSIQRMVSHINFKREERGTKYRLAVVTNSTIQEAIVNIFRSLASTLSFCVSAFPNEEDARAWLLEVNVAQNRNFS
jgi:hypothetical protein